MCLPKVLPMGNFCESNYSGESKKNEHLAPTIVDTQMLMLRNQETSIFFFFLLFLLKNNFSSTKIAFAILRDTRLFRGVTATYSTLGHLDHLLSLANLTDGNPVELHPHLIA
jgi:hypothetical protein